MANPRRRRWFALTLILFSTLVGLAVAEGFFRLHYLLTYSGVLEDLPEETPELSDGRKAQLGQIVQPSPYPRLVYELKPGLDVIFKGVPVRTNRARQREADLPRSKPERTVRLLGLGDSIMFGWGVAEEDRFMDVLERRLREELPEVGWQAVVIAAPGYNLVMEVEALRRYGLDYEPDLIVYGWHKNDVCLPNFLQNRRDVRSAELFALDYLRDFAWGAPRLLPKTKLAPRHACKEQDIPARYHALAGETAFARALEELAALGRAEGAPVVLVSPLDEVFEGVPPEGIHLVRASEHTGDVPEAELRLSERDVHPTPLGHRIIADAIFDELEAAGVWRALASL